MGETNNHIQFSATDIEKYWKGELSANSMHAMEKAALDDPFLADALDGYKSSVLHQKESVRSDVASLSKRLQERIEKDKVISLPRNRSGWWKIAASLIILIGGGVLAFQFFSDTPREQTIAKVVSSETESTKPKPVLTDSGKIATPTFLNSDSMQTSDVVAGGKSKLPRPAESNQLLQDQTTTTITRSKEVSEGITKKEAPAVSAPIAMETRKESDFKGDTVKREAEKSAVASATSAEKKKSDKNDDVNDRSRDMNGKTAGLAQSNLFNGRVIDQNNQPVAGAIVRFPLQRQATSTDANGFFNFTAPDTALTASITSVGFETQNLSLRNDNRSGLFQNNQSNDKELPANEIQLKPQNASLNEVVITGYGSQKRKANNLSKTKGMDVDVLEASPVVKADEYDRYLEKNRVLIDEVKNFHGTVVVSFTVTKKGLTDFKIEQHLHDYLDAEAIRLVKEGPGWKILKGKKARATVMVKF
jgi:hypothetical protein